jgi:hypothetical protein
VLHGIKGSAARRLGGWEAYSLKLHTIGPRGSATTRQMIRIVPFLLSGILAGCASASSPPLVSVDVVALCRGLTEASASKPELIDKDYFSQCMNAHGASAPAGQTKGQ